MPSHTVILEEMQPLYFFNVKAMKDSDSQNSFEDKRLAIKEASTPCFIGSPVNGVKPSMPFKVPFVVKASHERYHSFGSEQADVYE